MRLERYVYVDNECYACPTAEQMIGWLEAQGVYIEIHRVKSIDGVFVMEEYVYYMYVSIVYKKTEDTKFLSRKEATIAAIDAALEYLSNSKKE